MRVHVDADRFPPSTETVRLDCRWFTIDDFSIHYVETTTNGDYWECRWDRRPNSHGTRPHFHRTPTGNEIADLELPSLHPVDVLSTVLAAVDQRIEQAWDDS